MTIVDRPMRAVGPLEPFRDGFRQALVSQGYAPKPVELHLALLSNLSRWLQQRGLGPDALSPRLIERYLRGAAGLLHLAEDATLVGRRCLRH